MSSSPVRRMLAVAALAVACAAWTSPVPAGAVATTSPHAPAISRASWLWPVPGARMSRPFVAPQEPYGAGHRGIDLVPDRPARVRAPAAGVVAFVGAVAGRGVVTVDHGRGVVTTWEPVESARAVGDAVPAGADLGRIAAGGHAEPGTVHVGVRVDGAYVNPLLFFGGARRAVLLPCCT